MRHLGDLDCSSDLLSVLAFTLPSELHFKVVDGQESEVRSANIPVILQLYSESQAPDVEPETVTHFPFLCPRSQSPVTLVACLISADPEALSSTLTPGRLALIHSLAKGVQFLFYT